MTEVDQQWAASLISDFVMTSPANRFTGDFNEKAWDEVLVGFASGADPLFDAYKDLVGESHWTPLEIFRLAFPDADPDSAELTVISWVLPQREVVKADNARETTYPSARWIQARFPGEDFNNELRRHVVSALALKSVRAVAPVISPLFSWEKSATRVFSSKWSERHAAYAAGLGTFGLCDGLITSKGKAHRLGSVVAHAVIPPSTRPYSDHHAYCLYFSGGDCLACAERCPVGAISEAGHDKTKCWDHAGKTCAEYVKNAYGFDGYGCGLCQTGVPCESGVP
jgi:epoxyqueuosine reductase QueG